MAPMIEATFFVTVSLMSLFQSGLSLMVTPSNFAVIVSVGNCYESTYRICFIPISLNSIFLALNLE